ncbi:C40 family peptidase [Lacihabitans soyangensis]|uniref:Glycoside hydrolase n=1 Tax=Lacihabitans soyangensis TaxID=869394 RepID=A0AAE3KUR7_9BACT|nr:C40 family peptidase [Lacihabitans soyangensis]MCP9765234.1 glycoside hydrolase [Lacihabitans soyangensis]
MKKITLIVLLSLSYCANAQYEEHIEKIRKIYAPDKRTAIFEITYSPNTNAIVGKTNLREAKDALLSIIKNENVKDSVLVLPISNRNFEKNAVVNVSVANLRSKPEESAELASQVLLGMPLLVLEKTRGWYRVQCPDDYIGWIEGSTIKQFSETEYVNFKNKEKVIYVNPSGFAMSDTTSKAYSVRDVSFGNLLVFAAKSGRFTEVIFPDGKHGFVSTDNLQSSKDWLKDRQNSGEKIVENGRKMLGIPYLWGGTSFKGADCSGFTRMAFFASGLLLPRDASQQALIGDPVSIENDFSMLQKGDLLFFGNTTTFKVTHVGIWAGNKSFIHSSGMIQINSFDANSPDYDEYNLKRLLFVKRINPKALYLTGQNLYKF